MKRVLAVLVLSLVFVGSAAAYIRLTASTGETPSWPWMPIFYWINEDGLSQISNGSEFLAVLDAFQTWQNASAGGVRFDYRGTIPVKAPALDGVNLVTFVDDTTPLGSSTLAATFTFFGRDVAGALIITDSDIVVNSHQSWSTSGESGKYDIQSVLTHEVGHLLGLDHSGMISSVMTPFGAPSQIDLRTLQYDDIAGINELYPVSTPGGGQIRGSVMNGATPLFGAHVVALDRNGTAQVGAVTKADGSFVIRALPVGEYRIYAEPLDGPASAGNLGSFYSALSTDFGTTYFPNRTNLGEAQTITVTTAIPAVATIQVGPASSTTLNITRPVFAPRIGRQSAGTLFVGGTDLAAGALFSISSPADIALGTPVFGTGTSTAAPTNASIPMTVSASASLGSKVLAVHRGTDTAVGSAIFVVTDRQPTVSSINPASGPAAGQSRVVVTGSDFRTGARVYFGGIPSADVRFISSTNLDVLAPANSPGSANVQVVNADGTNGLKSVGYFYELPPPAISDMSPVSGPPTTMVTIDGANFDAQSQVLFNGVSAKVISASATRLVAAVPYGASTGPVNIVAFGQTAVGPVFSVTPSPGSSNHPSPVYDFIDASPSAGGTAISFANGDDGLASIALPFTFSLFRDIYPAGSSVTVVTNGFISLEQGASAEYQNGPLPSATAQRPTASGCFNVAAETRPMPRSMIAPFFDDLAIVPGVSSVSTRVFGTSPNRRLIVQWSKLTVLDESGCDLNSGVTFQAVLFEGSNDIQFLYATLTGGRSDAASATIGLQDFARTAGVQTAFNQPLLRNGFHVTYRFNEGQYTQFVPDSTPPSAPVVVDGGAFTKSSTELGASWTADDPESGVREYQFGLGTSPGIANVVPFASTTENFAILRQLSLAPGPTYYFAVRAVNNEGLVSSTAVSDGIQVMPSLQIQTKVIPYAPQNGNRYSGIALLAPSQMSVVLRAMSDSGSVLGTTTVALNPGQQYARLVSELFGLSTFDGWIEVEPSAPGLGVYSATGSWDLKDLDGTVPRDLSDDFVTMHPAAVMLVNPSNQLIQATHTGFSSQVSTSFTIPPRGRVKLILTEVSRITSSLPIAAIEDIEGQGRLSLAVPETIRDQSSFVFSQGVIGGGYASTLTLVNAGTGTLDVTVSFGLGTRSLQIPPNSLRLVSLADVSPTLAGEIRADAVRVTAAPLLIGTSRLLGALDVENSLNRVSLGSRPEATEFVFPHVAHGAGYFTGICLITGNAASTITVDVYTADGKMRRSATVVVGPNQQIARVISELVPSVVSQSGGYIRIYSSDPILAWEVYGSDEAFASGPPL